MTTIGVAVTSIPPRADMLRAALRSVVAQTRTPDRIHVAIDNDRAGVTVNRNNAWRALDTEWVAFLDDDDEFYPRHLEWLERTAQETGADLVYPWFDVRWRLGQVPFEFMFIGDQLAEGHPFDDDARATLLDKANFIPVTVLVRRALLEAVGGFPTPGTERWPHDDNEDWGCWKDMLAAGATFAHLPKRTWRWNWHYGHTMGRPDRW